MTPGSMTPLAVPKTFGMTKVTGKYIVNVVAREQTPLTLRQLYSLRVSEASRLKRVFGIFLVMGA